MDRFIAALPFEADADLHLCRAHGVAYQHDQTDLCAYDDAYYSKCASYEGQEIARRITAGRVAFVDKHLGPGPIVDVGIGSGEFVRNRSNTWGHDVNPAGIEWLRRNGRWTPTLAAFGAACMWDVVEHVPTPEDYFSQISLRGFLFFSLPIFPSLDVIRASKHYRPGEHLYYFEHRGFVAWMDRHGFTLLESSEFETEAGRESICSFAFRRYRSQP